MEREARSPSRGRKCLMRMMRLDAMARDGMMGNTDMAFSFVWSCWCIYCVDGGGAFLGGHHYYG